VHRRRWMQHRGERLPSSSRSARRKKRRNRFCARFALMVLASLCTPSTISLTSITHRSCKTNPRRSSIPRLSYQRGATPPRSAPRGGSAAGTSAICKVSLSLSSSRGEKERERERKIVLTVMTWKSPVRPIRDGRYGECICAFPRCYVEIKSQSLGSH